MPDERCDRPIERVDDPPYKTVGEVPRFSRSMTSFARQHRGEGRQGQSSPEKPGDGPAEGYSRLDFAVQHGAWVVARTMGELAYSWDGDSEDIPPYEPEDVAGFTREVKEAACLYGAGDAGVCRLDRRWLYADDDGDEAKHVPDDIQTAVVIAVPMDGHSVRQSPTARGAAASGSGYSRMAFTAACVAGLLRKLGYRALPCGNDTALSIPLAIDAGLGEMGRNGVLIHPRLGPCLRLCKVLTDAPLAVDKPIRFGVEEACEDCGLCAEGCPAQAISSGAMTTEAVCPGNSQGVLRWPVDGDACLGFWRENGTNCSTCIKVCPYMPAVAGSEGEVWGPRALV